MKNIIKFLGIIALVAVFGFGVLGCEPVDDGNNNNNNNNNNEPEQQVILDNFVFDYDSSKNGYIIRGRTSAEGIAHYEIPSEINGLSVFKIDSGIDGVGVFAGGSVTSVKIPLSITEVAPISFIGRSPLTTVIIPFETLAEADDLWGVEWRDEMWSGGSPVNHGIIKNKDGVDITPVFED